MRVERGMEEEEEEWWMNTGKKRRKLFLILHCKVSNSHETSFKQSRHGAWCFLRPLPSLEIKTTRRSQRPLSEEIIGLKIWRQSGRVGANAAIKEIRFKEIHTSNTLKRGEQVKIMRKVKNCNFLSHNLNFFCEILSE